MISRFSFVASLLVLFTFTLFSCQDNDEVVTTVPDTTFLVKTVTVENLYYNRTSLNEYYYDVQDRLVKFTSTEHNGIYMVTYEYGENQIIQKEYWQDELDYHSIYTLENGRIVSENLPMIDLNWKYAYNDKDQLISILSDDGESILIQEWSDGNITMQDRGFVHHSIEYTDLPFTINFSPINNVLLGFQGARTKNLPSKVVADNDATLTFSYELDELGRPIKYFKITDGETYEIITLNY